MEGAAWCGLAHRPASRCLLVLSGSGLVGLPGEKQPQRGEPPTGQRVQESLFVDGDERGYLGVAGQVDPAQDHHPPEGIDEPPALDPEWAAAPEGVEGSSVPGEVQLACLGVAGRGQEQPEREPEGQTEGGCDPPGADEQ